MGAGASGSVAAYHLAKAGFSVVCLEQGGWVKQTEYPGNHAAWELLSQKRWHPNPNVRQLAIDYPVNTEESDVNPLMYNAVGGGTILYAAQWHRFRPSDFRVKSLDGVADDWPFSYEDLEPYYRQMDLEIGVSGLGGNPAYPEGNNPPLPPLPIGKVGRKAAEGLNKLGWHWWPGYNAIPSRSYRNLNKCALRGTCLTGCAEGSKASMDLVYWQEANNNGAKLVTGARVKEITVNERGLAKGAVYIDRRGREHFQPASVVILGANGVGTPRLLLLSKSAKFPEGLANSSGLVGRRLMMHPFAVVQGQFEENLESWVGPTGELINSMEFYETDEKRGFVRGAKWDLMGTGGPLGMRSAYGGRPIKEAWGENFHRSVKKNLGRSVAWGIIAEDLPDENNRVVLDDLELTDSDGIPSPKVIYKMSNNTRNLMEFHIERAKESLDAAGATDTLASPLMKDCGWHLLGTARMGKDPETSVVNEWCQSHDVPNLYIIDGSVFVTSAGVNPTATICAIALRAVDHMIQERRNQEVPV
ncbi:GMC family oxidoreductase [Pueribacillus theae]|uniref:GMC family oxidoreductase n=1 Tax=Pueribacillus theae TaxID=2171751 RepID=A0A2U1K343_9BACI|nr:GMC family oxidoreductase [Pueribacillus theae]